MRITVSVAMYFLPHVSTRVTLLDLCLEEGEDPRQQPVNQRCDGKRLECPALRFADHLGAIEELLYGAYDADQRRVFEHGDEVVTGGRNDHSHCLGEDDTPHRLPCAHAEGVCGLRLATPDRLNPGAKDLGH